MGSFEDLKRKQISNAIQKKTSVPIEKIGHRLKDIRISLGMTQKQLAEKINIKQSEVSRIEKNAEVSSLVNIQRYAQALGLDFQGVFTSERTLEEIIKDQAEKKAKKILERTFSNMAMEKQAPQDEAYRFQFNKLVEEFISNPNSGLWEE